MAINNISWTNLLFAKTSKPTGIQIEERTVDENGSINIETSYVKLKLKTLLMSIGGLVVFIVTVTWTASTFYHGVQTDKALLLAEKNRAKTEIQHDIYDSILVGQRKILEELK